MDPAEAIKQAMDWYKAVNFFERCLLGTAFVLLVFFTIHMLE
ncbi:hypothetical protein [Anaerocolumna xylanovorans]|uniref:Uncharacterized protein n=1 Tax=Anaerocolumna xylanovorans DSM 12503 TaxID=1121345 RepID=A0A1M7XY57_9FIRM|nr:hypothetical protein [Anaerocolumna xylanovorans]SHO43817.1 hypothetical protein SAMN02745217_00366 [Anaerocolumna xylanovorans DSM 12503]